MNRRTRTTSVSKLELELKVCCLKGRGGRVDISCYSVGSACSGRNAQLDAIASPAVRATTGQARCCCAKLSRRHTKNGAKRQRTPPIEPPLGTAHMRICKASTAVAEKLNELALVSSAVPAIMRMSPGGIYPILLVSTGAGAVHTHGKRHRVSRPKRQVTE